MDEEAIVSQLAPTLRRLVQQHLIGRTVQCIPVFSSDRPYATLDRQLQVYMMLRPLLREAKEPISESLEFNAEGGPSIFFMVHPTLLRPTYYLLPTAYYLLPTTSYLPTSSYVLRPAYGLLLGACCLLRLLPLTPPTCYVSYLLRPLRPKSSVGIGI